MSDPLAASARPLSLRYKVWLCDVWGVVHNGARAHESACEALIKHRENGGIVILITNAPRPHHAVAKQLRGLHVPDEIYDVIVPSGDVTRSLVSAHTGGKIFFFGPERDLQLKEGLEVEWSELDEADGVLCTGLYNDRTDQPSDYQDTFDLMLARDLPMICANPDLVVQFGDRLLPCAGALAAHYAAMGGIVEMAGKPFSPIYDVSLQRAGEILGQPVEKSQCLAIGDGMKTDIAGAANYNIAVAFISGGIHDNDIGATDNVEELAGIARNAVKGVNVVAAMRKLEW
jgi:HAD superfamily hydrolase (TIGR01459 family)